MPTERRSFHPRPWAVLTALCCTAVALGCVGAPTSDDYPYWRLNRAGDSSFNGWRQAVSACENIAMVDADKTSGPLKSDIDGMQIFDERVFYACMQEVGWTRTGSGPAPAPVANTAAPTSNYTASSPPVSESKYTCSCRGEPYGCGNNAIGGNLGDVRTGVSQSDAQNRYGAWRTGAARTGWECVSSGGGGGQSYATPQPTSPTMTPEQACYDMVQGRVAWNRAGSTNWQPGNVRDFCSGVSNPQARIACFNDQVSRYDNWSQAVSTCKSVGGATVSGGPTYTPPSDSGSSVPVDNQRYACRCVDPPCNTVVMGTTTIYQAQSGERIDGATRERTGRYPFVGEYRGRRVDIGIGWDCQAGYSSSSGSSGSSTSSPSYGSTSYSSGPPPVTNASICRCTKSSCGVSDLKAGSVTGVSGSEVFRVRTVAPDVHEGYYGDRLVELRPKYGWQCE